MKRVGKKRLFKYVSINMIHEAKFSRKCILNVIFMIFNGILTAQLSFVFLIVITCDIYATHFLFNITVRILIY